jgi:predicted molibdopterin-dependent oxidoreductase YjgC
MASVEIGRLPQPLIRKGGELTPATWDEALDLVATRFGELKARYGPDVFGCYSCSKTTNELNFLAQKFARAVLGTNNVDSCNRT